MTKRIKGGFSLLLVFLLGMSLWGCGLLQPEVTDASTQPVETTEETLPAGAGEYTYRLSMTQAPNWWSPMQWENSTDEFILENTAMGLYAAVANPDGDGYLLQPEMAAAAPEDVTAIFAGNSTYGVPADAQSGYAFRIDLNPDAVWEDGTPINADTYIYSMRQMLDCDQQNYRAAGFYSGQVVLAGAYNYHMQNQVGLKTYRTLADAGYSSVAEARNDGVTEFYLDMTSFWGLGCGWVNLEDETLYVDDAVSESDEEAEVSAKYLYETYLADGATYAAYQTAFVGLLEKTVEETTFDQVGLLKTGEYQIVLILEKPTTAEILQSNLLLGWLVKEDLYEQWGLFYGTAVDRYASCGPYKLTYISEEEIQLARNDAWYGYSDGKHQGQYQTTAIDCRIIEDTQQVQEAFENGELDMMTLSRPAADALSVPQTYVSKLTFNTSLSMLAGRQREGINKTLLFYEDFRKAISLSLDRAAFVADCTPTSQPALGLLGDSFLSDVATGEGYRDSELGRQVIANVYGSADATGYDLQGAKALFQQAYDQAVAEGMIGEEDVVELEFLVYSGENPVYNAIVASLQHAINDATAGTSLADRITVVKTVDPDYYQTAQSGQFEIILSTWGGVDYDPYSIMSCYCDENKKFEFGFEPSYESCTITLGDAAVTKTYRGWYELLVNGKYVDADQQTRNRILAGLEQSLLESYICVPVYQRSTLVLDASRIQRTVEEALPLVELGGLRYITYTEDDRVWRVN